MAERALATAYVNIVPGTKAMKAYLEGGITKEAGAGGNKAGTAFGSAFKKVAGAAIFAVAAKQVADFVGSAVSSANKLFIEYEGVSSVFGEAAGSVQAFAKTAAKTAGISESAALAAAKGFGGFATSAKLGAAEAAKFSIDLTKAAGDMASFYGGGTEASLSAIKSALMGSYEPMLKYNQQLTEMRVRDEAVRLGLTKTTAEALDPNTKALAVQSLIMSGLGVATGDFVTYADSFDNAQQTMAANFENMKASIGTSLLPVLGQLVAAINPLIEKAGPLLFDVFQKLIPLFELITASIEKILPALDPIISAFGMLVDVVVEILEVALPPLLEIFNALIPVLKPIMGLFMSLVKAILPPLAKIFEKVLIPILLVVVDVLVKFVLPYFTKLADIMGGALTWAVDMFVKAFQYLQKKLAPVWEAIKPFVEGFMSLLGLKPIKITASISTKMDTAGLGKGGIPAADSIDYSKLGDGMGGGAAGSTKKTAAAIKKTITKFNKDIAKANKTYGKAVDTANKKWAEDQSKIYGDYNDTVGKLTDKRNDDLAKALKDHNKKVVDINADFANRMAEIVQQSKDRLRSAFESVTAVDVGKTFADIATRNITSLIMKLRTGLNSARDLVANAGALASAGFSQTFIEQIVAQGPDAGNAMAKAILTATPEAQGELQTLFAETEKLSAHGMDTLANTMYEKSGLATEALRNLYSQAQIDLQAALLAENEYYTAQQLEIQATFQEGMTEAAKVRDEALAEAEKALTEALTAATAALNESLNAIEKEFNAAMKEFKGQLSAHATAIRNIKDEIAAARAEAMKPIVVTRIENVIVNTTTKGRVPMAEGGFVNGPVNALIGEAGPEVVTPLKDFERMMGLDSGNGKTIIYNAAPNQSLDAEQALFQAIKRAKVVGTW